MTEINIPLGWFNIDYDCFRGFSAPDEDVRRPVSSESMQNRLYSR